MMVELGFVPGEVIDELTDEEYSVWDVLDEGLEADSLLTLAFDGTQPVILFRDSYFGDVICNLSDASFVSIETEEEFEESISELASIHALKFEDEEEQRQFIKNLKYTRS